MPLAGLSSPALGPGRVSGHVAVMEAVHVTGAICLEVATIGTFHAVGVPVEATLADDRQDFPLWDFCPRHGTLSCLLPCAGEKMEEGIGRIRQKHGKARLTPFLRLNARHIKIS